MGGTTQPGQPSAGVPKQPEPKEETTKSSLLPGFKEVVTALLAFAIIIPTLILIGISLYPTPNMDNAQGIFSLLGGWCGVILGYYFGRVPAEKAADVATKAADKAQNEKDAAVEGKAVAETEKKQAQADKNRILQDQRRGLTALQQQLTGTTVAAKGSPDLVGEISKMIEKIDDELEKIE